MSSLRNVSIDAPETCINCIENETILNDYIRTDIFLIVNMSVLTTVISFIGILTNIINIVVFWYQGMKTTVSICFMALSITDMLNLLTIEWSCLCFNPLITSATEFPFVPGEIQELTGGLPHVSFTRIIAWITVFLTAERCLCILFPFKIKELITPKRTIAVIAFIYAIVFMAAIPEYSSAFIDWKFYPNLNKTLLGLVFVDDRAYLYNIYFILISIIMVTSFPATILLTAVLIIKLKETTHWRNQAKSHKKNSYSLDYKDRLAIRSVVVVAGVLICTFAPSVVFSVLCFIVPGFRVNGENTNIFQILGSFTFVFDAINSSINIVIYYKLNSGFRKTCLELLHGCLLKQVNPSFSLKM